MNSEDEFIKETSSEVTPVSSRGEAWAVPGRDFQPTFWMVPVLYPRLPHPQAHPRSESSIIQGIRWGWREGRRTASQVAQGRKKNILQPRFLRNPHKLRMEKQSHSQAGGLLLIPHQRSHPRRRRKTLLSSWVFQARTEKAASCRRSRTVSGSQAATDTISKSKGEHVSEKPDEEARGRKYSNDYSDKMRAPTE